MTMRSGALVVALVMAQGSALAQTRQRFDARCPLNVNVLEQQIAPGRLATMSVKNRGNKDCTESGDCSNIVEVAQFTRENGQAACCTRIEWASMTAIKDNKRVDFKWSIASPPNTRFVFNPNGIYFIQPPVPTPADLGPLKLSNHDQEARIKSINDGPVTFNYGVSVSMDLGQGKYLACDQNDPVIVNQGS